MLVKTEAVVLGAIKYGDSSIILRTYSKYKGLISFIAGGLRSRKGPLRPAMVQVLSVLQLVYYDNSKGELKRVKEASVEEPLQEIFYDPVKSSLAMFLAEILQHVLQEEAPNEDLYSFIHTSVYTLDSITEGSDSFHLKFLYRLAGYLGFRPESPPADPRYFDLLNGVYSTTEPPHANCLYGAALVHWLKLGEESKKITEKSSLNKEQRKQTLDSLILYYRLHVKDFGKLRSLEILSEILN